MDPTMLYIELKLLLIGHQTCRTGVRSLSSENIKCNYSKNHYTLHTQEQIHATKEGFKSILYSSNY